jgi:UDP-N-acetylglucosamine 2-epimerase (non-hydrolysing)
MQLFEPVVLRERPDWVLVVGDVNSTLACALVCSKIGIKVAHVEAGLRSRDRTMPEEINRIVTDQVADLLLTPSPDADRNLAAEGIPQERIRLVGNVMIDSLFANLRRAESSEIRRQLGLEQRRYATLTLHRPSNVDDLGSFTRILDALEVISGRLPIVFPAHPRTRERIRDFGLSQRFAEHENIRMIEPLGYLDFLRLYSGATLVLTDSGGIQEETTALSIPCLTLRENTERPITVEMGTNNIVGTSTEKIIEAAMDVLNGEGREAKLPPLWDGRTADRILGALLEFEEE